MRCVGHGEDDRVRAFAVYTVVADMFAKCTDIRFATVFKDMTTSMTCSQVSFILLVHSVCSTPLFVHLISHGMNSAQLRLLSDLREMKMDVAGDSVMNCLLLFLIFILDLVSLRGLLLHLSTMTTYSSGTPPFLDPLKLVGKVWLQVHRFFLHISSFSQRWHLFFAPNIL